MGTRRWTALPAALALTIPVLVAGPARAQATGGCPEPVKGAVIEGTAGDDVLTGTAGDDIIRAGDGNDRVDGAGGNDVIHGAGGVDILLGGPGCDTLYGGDGIDFLSGGLGEDTGDGGGQVNVCDVEDPQVYWIVSYLTYYCGDAPL